MYCISCGKQQQTETSYCPFCGTQQPVLDKLSLAPQSSLAKTPGEIEKPTFKTSSASIPTGDVEPLFKFENVRWWFKYKPGNVDPPEWLFSPIDLMISNDYVFFISNGATANWMSSLGNAAIAAGTVAAASVPFVGIPMGLAALATGKLMNKRRHPGYGKNNQFKREVLFLAMEHGKCMWIEKSACNFIAYSYRELLFDVHHCVSISGQFNTCEGIVALSAYGNFGYNGKLGCYGSDFKKDLQQDGLCAISNDIKVKNDDDAFGHLSSLYPIALKAKN
jgi:hypothetical protein